MANLRKFGRVIVMVSLCFLLLEANSYGCTTDDECLNPAMTLENRKVLHENVRIHKENNGSMTNQELRDVPSGPDPLHHHGATPKKPQTP